MACDGYTKVWNLSPRELVLLDGARGTTLRVTRGRIWLTQERDLRDIVLEAGDAFTVERGGRTIIEAQSDTTVCVVPRYVEAIRNRGRRSRLHRVRAWLRTAGAALVPGRRWVPYF